MDAFRIWSCAVTNTVRAIDDRTGIVTSSVVSSVDCRNDAWPPTGWFVEWTRGVDIFNLPVGKTPVDMRWVDSPTPGTRSASRRTCRS